MAATQRRLWSRVYLNDVWTLTSGDITVNESLDSLTRVAEFDLAEQPTVAPAESDAVRIQWLDIDAATGWDLFGGEINAVEIESQPWAYVVRCTGQLSRLRRVRTASDLDLTGMTDGEAWKAVADYCGVTYDAADIADAGYVLGERVAVSWLLDVPGSQIIGELDTVLGMATIEIGNDRVIRFPYDPTPNDATGLYRTYTRGESIDFTAHRRTRGDRDQIQNVWVVRGATATDNDNCSLTPWARAESGNAQLGRGVSVTTQTFSSDLIQDEALAEAIVRRQMRLTNRLPDDATAECENDPNMHPGAKIAIVDPAYGVDADPRYFLVTAVNRTGAAMTLTLTAGPGGSEGTVTHGVDRVCNDLHFDVDWPGSFSFPGFDFPPFDIGFDLDFSVDFPFDFGGLVVPALDEKDVAGSGGTTPGSGDWLVAYGDWTFGDGTASETSGSGRAYYIGPDTDGVTGEIGSWNSITLTATGTIDPMVNDREFFTALLSDADSAIAGFELWGIGYGGATPYSNTYGFVSSQAVNYTADAQSPGWTLVVVWTAAINQLTSQWDGNVLLNQSITLDAFSNPVKLSITNESNGGGLYGSLTLTDITVTVT